MRGGQRLVPAALVNGAKNAVRAAVPVRSAVRNGSDDRMSGHLVAEGARSFPDGRRTVHASERLTARRLQASWPGWLVMWSPWRRKFTAFAGFTRDAVVLDEPTAELLAERMHRVEMRAVVPAGRW